MPVISVCMENVAGIVEGPQEEAGIRLGSAMTKRATATSTQTTTTPMATARISLVRAVALMPRRLRPVNSAAKKTAQTA